MYTYPDWNPDWDEAFDPRPDIEIECPNCGHVWTGTKRLNGDIEWQDMGGTLIGEFDSPVQHGFCLKCAMSDNDLVLRYIDVGDHAADVIRHVLGCKEGVSKDGADDIWAMMLDCDRSHCADIAREYIQSSTERMDEFVEWRASAKTI